MFKVENGVDVPKRKGRSGKYAEFLKELKVGQSISETDEGGSITAGMVAGIRTAAKNAGLCVITRCIGDGAYRVWRSEKEPSKNGKKRSR